MICALDDIMFYLLTFTLETLSDETDEQTTAVLTERRRQVIVDFKSVKTTTIE